MINGPIYILVHRRGNGWAMLGLVDALRWGGIVDPHRSTYLAVYKEFASRLLELQYFRAGSAKSVGLFDTGGDASAQR